MILACSCQSGQAIDVSFSAENGGEKVGVSSTYDVDTDISVLESNTASFGDTPSLQNSRQISGTGDANATQVCTGNAYASRSTYDATDASTSFSSSASLLPQSLSASQIAGASGGKADSSLGITQGGATASISGGMTGGAMSASQSIWTGSAHASQGLSASGDQVRFGGTAESGNRQGYLGATTHDYQGTLDASATGDFADVMEMGELSGGYTVEGIIGGVRRSATTVTGTWLRDMRATDADNIEDTTDRTGGLEGFNHILQTIIDETPDGGTAIFPVGALSEDVILWKNVQVIVELGGRMIANSINLVQNAELLSGSTGFFSPIVTVNEGSKINDGLQLASDSGTVTVKSGIYNDVVNQEFYSHGIQLNGEAGSVTDQIILDQYVNGKIDGLHADTVQVNQGASINDGLVLAKDSGLVSVTAGTYADNVNQGFYSRGIQLNGDDGAITSQITLDRDVNSEISGLRGSTVQVNSGASIQEGVDLATGTGTVNVDSGVADGQTVIYSKDVFLNANSNILDHLTIDRNAFRISGFNANTVQVNSGALIQDGVNLATASGTVNVDNSVDDGQNLNYNKNVYLNANNNILNQLTIDRDTIRISDLTANTVQVHSGASINQGLGLSETDGTVNVAAGTYADTVTQDFYSKNIQLNGASGAMMNKITLDRNVFGKISGLLADSVDVGTAAKIQQGLTLTKAAGVLNLATGHDYAEDVDYSKGVTLNGHDATTTKLTLSTDAAGISSLLANTVDVTSAAKIQQGLYVTKAGGTLNLASGNNYAEDVDYNKVVSIQGNGATTTSLALNADPTNINGIKATTVNAGAFGTIQKGLELSKDTGATLVLSNKNYAESVDYNKVVSIQGNGATTTSLALNADPININGIKATTVNAAAFGTIQKGLELSKDTGATLVLSNKNYAEDLNYNKVVSIQGNGATTNSLILNVDPIKINGLRANTVDATVGFGTIQKGLDLTSTSGTLYLRSGKNYAGNVNYDRSVSIQGGGASTTSLTLSADASPSSSLIMSGLTAIAVKVNSGGSIQDGIDLSTSGHTLTVGSGTFYERLTINKDLTIDGGGTAQTVINGQNGGTTVTVNSGTVTLKELKVTGGNAYSGGGIINRATLLTLQDTLVQNNQATNGGGIYNLGYLTLGNGAVISSNAAENGGGIYSTYGMINMNSGSSVRDNSATQYGGGIELDSGNSGNSNALFLNSGSTIYSNHAGQSGTDFGLGGGVSLMGDRDWIYLNGGSVFSNHADVYAGILDNSRLGYVVVESNGNLADVYSNYRYTGELDNGV